MVPNSISPSIQFAHTDVTSPADVGRFMFWLYDGQWPEWYGGTSREERPRFLEQDSDLTELFWSWDAPKKRMMKLLWNLLQNNNDEEFFRNQLTISLEYFVEDAAMCSALLPPIQQRLLWVLDGLEHVARQDASIGQGDWGEELYLPAEQASHMREQLSKARLDLLEKPAEYAEAVEMQLKDLIMETGALDIPITAPDRTYRFETGWAPTSMDRVWVESGGKTEGLVSARDPLTNPGTGFAWGYFGKGSYNLALSILTDATGGDIGLAEKFAAARVKTPEPQPIGVLTPLLNDQPSFQRDFIASLPDVDPPPITRSQILTWLAAHGVDEGELAKRQVELTRRRDEVRPHIDKCRAILEKIRTQGPLRAQRFDLVPVDFECALYVDLMEYTRSGGRFMRCNRCERVIASDGSPRSSQQRARFRRDQPIYHEDCFLEVKKEKKRADFQRRMQDPEYRERHRNNSRERRQEELILELGRATDS